MTHPRLSVSALSSVRWSFAEDLACWQELGIVADIGNFWMERGLRRTLERAAPHIALVQDPGDRQVALAERHPAARRRVVGAAHGADRIVGQLCYAGPLELELIGPLSDREGYGPVIRRGVAAAEAVLGAAGL
jgi:hypothetical protein